MKLILIPPYKGINYDPDKGQFLIRELVADMERRGQLAGVEIDIDEGYPFPKELDARARNDEVLAHITVGVVKKAREYSEMGKYDAIVTTGDLEPGFFAVRSVSRIPVASVTYSAIHAASLIGDRFTLIAMSDVAAAMIRRLVQSTGFSHKLVSVRYPSYSVSCSMAGSIELIGKFRKEERVKVPELKKIIDDITKECIAAIETDRVDSIILGCSALQVYADEISQELDDRSYGEIPVIGALSAGVEMAKAMVNMKVTQAARAYPAESLKAKPIFR